MGSPFWSLRSWAAFSMFNSRPVPLSMAYGLRCPQWIVWPSIHAHIRCRGGWSQAIIHLCWSGGIGSKPDCEPNSFMSSLTRWYSDCGVLSDFGRDSPMGISSWFRDVDFGFHLLHSVLKSVGGSDVAPGMGIPASEPTPPKKFPRLAAMREHFQST